MLILFKSLEGEVGKEIGTKNTSYCVGYERASAAE
jgi:hypothetical protein